MSDNLRSDVAFDVDDLMLKAAMCCGKRVIVVKAQLVKKVKFFLLSYENDEVNVLSTCDLYATSVVDFLFVESSPENNEIMLWAVTRESYEGAKGLDSMFQPYLLQHCLIDL
jgi:hypothetical protein